MNPPDRELAAERQLAPSPEPALDTPPPTSWTVRAMPWVRRAVKASVFAAGLFAALVTTWVRPDHWMVEHVEFRGINRADATALRHLIDLQNGTTVWSVDLKRVARGAERHPWVREATAHREFPDRVVVDVREHVPAALLLTDRLSYVDEDGQVFMEAHGEDLNYPVVTGIDPKLGEAHPDLPGLVVRDALRLAERLDAEGLVTAHEISEISFSPARGYTVILRRPAASRLVFGLEGHDRQMARLHTLIEKGVDLRRAVQIDLAPERIAIVRPLAPTAPGT